MSNFTALCKADEIKADQMKEVMVQDQAILISNVGGKYYAVAGRCPHLGGQTGAGEVGRYFYNLSETWFPIRYNGWTCGALVKTIGITV